MTEGRHQIVLCRDEREHVTLEALAARAGLPLARVERYLEFGLLEPVGRAESQILFDMAAVPRLRMIERLRHDIGINLAGISVVLDMLDRLRALQLENERMRLQL